MIDFGNKTTKENNADKNNEEKPTNEIIYNLFSIDYFFNIFVFSLLICNSDGIPHLVSRCP